VITADDMRRYGIRSIDQAINFLASAMIAEKRFQTTEVGARGVLLTTRLRKPRAPRGGRTCPERAVGADGLLRSWNGNPFEIIDHIEASCSPGLRALRLEAMLAARTS